MKRVEIEHQNSILLGYIGDDIGVIVSRYIGVI